MKQDDIMISKATDAPSSPVRRRLFVRTLGVSGLGAAAAIFGGRQTSAEAIVSFGCCHLAYGSQGRVSYCLSKSHYVWYCNESGGVYCTCCEIKDTNGNFIESDASCQY